MPQGKVKWFDEEKGFGFIVPDDSTPDVFVHYSAIQTDGFRTLAENDVVQYELETSEKGPRAANVTKPGETPAATE